MKPIRLWLGQDKDGSCSLYDEFPNVDFEETYYYAQNGTEILCDNKNLLGGSMDLVKCVVITESEYNRLKETEK